MRWEFVFGPKCGEEEEELCFFVFTVSRICRQSFEAIAAQKFGFGEEDTFTEELMKQEEDRAENDGNFHEMGNFFGPKCGEEEEELFSLIFTVSRICRQSFEAIAAQRFGFGKEDTFTEDLMKQEEHRAANDGNFHEIGISFEPKCGEG
jgi:hypothetical protein